MRRASHLEVLVLAGGWDASLPTRATRNDQRDRAILGHARKYVNSSGNFNPVMVLRCHGSAGPYPRQVRNARACDASGCFASGWIVEHDVQVVEGVLLHQV